MIQLYYSAVKTFRKTVPTRAFSLCYNVSAMVKTVKELQFKVLIEQDENRLYVASVPELPGCYTQAKTLEEVRRRIKEVIELVLEADRDVREEKLRSPRGSGFFGVDEVTIQGHA